MADDRERRRTGDLHRRAREQAVAAPLLRHWRPTGRLRVRHPRPYGRPARGLSGRALLAEGQLDLARLLGLERAVEAEPQAGADDAAQRAASPDRTDFQPQPGATPAAGDLD